MDIIFSQNLQRRWELGLAIEGATAESLSGGAEKSDYRIAWPGSA